MKFAVPGFDVVSDFYGSISGVKLTVPGSQWFIIPAIISYLNSRGVKTYFETLPEVFIRKRANGAPISIGNLIIEDKPEIICQSNRLIHDMKAMERKEAFEDTLCVAYTGKKKQVSISELKNLRFAIPNPRTSSTGIAFKNYYEEKCGYYGELKENTAICDVPNREIPKKLINGDVDYGIMLKSEAIHWKFRHYFPDVVKEKFSWLLLENASPAAIEVFHTIESGTFNEYYARYDYTTADRAKSPV
ncbi:type 2 periplasmic-binding domain-containing protein [Ferroplasma acidarmanus]|uniref:Uncharacterized protein n=1 Tax=Ferroplasma acidarmanus Fer1 TaxID=333146 RepID=S0APU4_FERAC|nr:hypothetical protein [Ferroplasma acidarmanus]AGO61273.1 hypothetical protein FACI_IFERC00001G1293 [Ferroplasma acidarmanus Fer1]